jgi:TonB family protein
MLVLAGAIGGIVYFTRKDSPPPEPTAKIEPKPPEPVHNAPPPPPPPKLEDLPDAGDDAGDAGKTDVKPSAGTGGGGGTCSKCTEGISSSALNSKMQALAGSAQGCYNRALRTSAASGKITVSVQVGSTGSVCSASISNDTVGSGEISSCVLNRFKTASLPPPEKGCVTIQVPINFKIAE